MHMHNARRKNHSCGNSYLDDCYDDSEDILYGETRMQPRYPMRGGRRGAFRGGCRERGGGYSGYGRYGGGYEGGMSGGHSGASNGIFMPSGGFARATIGGGYSQLLNRPSSPYPGAQQGPVNPAELRVMLIARRRCLRCHKTDTVRVSVQTQR